MARCPKTAAEAWKRLDKRLSEEDKKAIIEAAGMWEFHFSLGMWIRNYWIYRGEDENLKSLLKDLGAEVVDMSEELSKEFPACHHEPMLIGHPDSFSSVILEAYQKHLKELYGNK